MFIRHLGKILQIELVDIHRIGMILDLHLTLVDRNIYSLK